jgi:hypothetical protein
MEIDLHEKVTRNSEPKSLAESIAAKGSACPIPLTHDRFFETHYWWHEMARTYHEPEPFRYSIGAFVQAARSVTFMLQKEKRIFEDFSWKNWEMKNWGLWKLGSENFFVDDAQFQG